MSDFQRERELEDIRAQMATEVGRRIVHGQLERAGVFRSTFAAGAPDITAFQEGQRSQGLALLAVVMAACPNQYIRMTEEAKALAEQDAKRMAAEKPKE